MIAQKPAHIDSPLPPRDCNDRGIVNDSVEKSITDAFCFDDPVDNHFNDKFSCSLHFQHPSPKLENSNIDLSWFMNV